MEMVVVVVVMSTEERGGLVDVEGLQSHDLMGWPPTPWMRIMLCRKRSVQRNK